MPSRYILPLYIIRYDTFHITYITPTHHTSVLVIQHVTVTLAELILSNYLHLDHMLLHKLIIHYNYRRRHLLYKREKLLIDFKKFYQLRIEKESIGTVLLT